MKSFVLIFGPQAVGKMTIAQELTKMTKLKLLHNHMTIELLEPLFGFSPELFRLSDLFRTEIFKAFTQGNSEGLIFTFLWAFNLEEDWKKVEEWCRIFRMNNVNIYFVELEADINVRIARNKTANRLKHKPTKRNVEQSEAHLINSLETHRFNSKVGEIKEDNYFRINNIKLSPADVGKQIKAYFQF